MTVMASMFRCAWVAVAACLLAATPSAAAQAPDAAPTAFELRGDSAAGEPLYLRHCAACHGPRGAGDGQQGRAFDPGPPDFSVGPADAERFYRATRDGGMAVGVSAAMPIFRHTLSEKQLQDVTAHLMQLAQ